MAPRPMSPLNKGDGVVEGVKLYLVLLQVCQPFVGDLPRRCRRNFVVVVVSSSFSSSSFAVLSRQWANCRRCRRRLR